MAEEYSHSNPLDEEKDIFSNKEEQVSEISRNMVFLMATLENKFWPFRKASGSNSEDGSARKLKDNEDPKLEKEQPSSSAITPS
jgi:hypothetical protein